MKIVGGSYGVTGKLRMEHGDLIIQSAAEKRIPCTHLARVNTSMRSERKFSALAFVIWAVIFTALGGLFLGPLGAIGGMVIATITSFSNQKTLCAEVTFTDGTTLSVEGWHYEIQKLVQLVHS